MTLVDDHRWQERAERSLDDIFHFGLPSDTPRTCDIIGIR